MRSRGLAVLCSPAALAVGLLLALPAPPARAHYGAPQVGGDKKQASPAPKEDVYVRLPAEPAVLAAEVDGPE